MKGENPSQCVSIGPMSIEFKVLRVVTFALLRSLRLANMQRIFLLRDTGASTEELFQLSTGDHGDASLIRGCPEHILDCAETARFA